MYASINKKYLKDNEKNFEKEAIANFGLTEDEETQLLFNDEKEEILELGIEDGRLILAADNKLGYFSITSDELTDDELFKLRDQIDNILKEKARRINKILRILEE